MHPKFSLLIDNQMVEFSNLIEVIKYHVQHHPDQDVLIFLANGEDESGRLNYRQLDEKARTIAAHLQASIGQERTDVPRALLAFQNGLEFISAFFGCLYAGVCAVPVFPPQNRESYLQRLELIAKDCQAEFILGLSDYLDLVEDKFAAFETLSAAKRIAVDQCSLQETNESGRGLLAQSDSLAFFQYTSGSTSNPKGVMVSHGNLLHNIGSMQRRWNHDHTDTIVSWLPMFHDMGLIGVVLQSICIGARCVAMTPAAFLQKPMRWLQALTKYRGTSSFAPNFAYDLCALRAKPDDIESLDLSTWNLALNGAEPIRAQTLESFSTTFAPCHFRAAAMYPAYGLAEATLYVSGSEPLSGVYSLNVDAKRYEQENQVHLVPSEHPNCRTLVSSGIPAPEHTVVIVDPDSHKPCAEGEVGEIWVHSDSVAGGYWDNIDASKVAFEARIDDANHPHADKNFLRTGDLGFLWQQQLFIAGRIKDVLIIRGANYYPQEIEELVQSCVEGFKNNAGAAFTTMQGEQQKLVLVQEIERTSIKTLDRKQAFLKAKQAVSEEFGLSLDDIVIIKPAAIPKTSSGKIQRSKARLDYEQGNLNTIAQYSQMDWAETSSAKSKSSSGSVNPEHQLLQDVLTLLIAKSVSISPEQIDIERPLTAYGLDSLQMAELGENVKLVCGIEIPLQQWLAGTNVVDVAHFIMNARKSPVLQSEPVTPSFLVTDELSLSVNQQQLMLIHEKAPYSSAYNVALCIKGDFDPVRAEQALTRVVALHPVLLTRIQRTSDNWQPISAQPKSTLLNVIQQAQDLETELLKAAKAPFDLYADEPFRFVLFKGINHSNERENEADRLLLSFHHICVDMLSVLIFTRQFLQCYQDPEAELTFTENSKTYGQFVHQQRNYLASPQSQESRDYWQSLLQQDIPVLHLPVDKRRPQHQSFVGQSWDFRLSGDVSQQLRNLAVSAGVTLNSVLLGLYQVFLSKLCYQKRFAIGVLNAGRPDSDYRDTVGYFVEPGVFLAELSQIENVSSLLTETHRQMLDIVKYQGAALQTLMDNSSQQSEGIPPVFQTLFNFYPKLSLGLIPFSADAKATTIEAFPEFQVQHLPAMGAQLDLSLLVADDGQYLQMRFEYNEALFESSTVERFAEYLNALAQQFAEHPKAKPAGFSLLSARRLQRQDVALPSQDNVEIPQENRQIQELIFTQIAASPDSEALRFDGKSMSYAELGERVDALASRLIDLCPVESVIGVCYERSFDMVISLLAILRAGCAYLPLDPEMPAERLRYCLETAGVVGVLCQPKHELKFQAWSANWPVWSIEEANHVGTQSARFCPDNACAYVIFTSGSTGKPKGVMNSHQGIRNRLLWMQKAYNFDTAQRTLQKTPYTFDVSIWELFLPLMSGGTLVIAKPGGHQEADYLLQLIQAERVSALHFVPSMLDVFLENFEQQENAGLPSLKQVFCSGEALSKKSAERFLNKFSSTELHNLYGPTEAAIDVTSWHCKEVQSRHSVPIGWSIANIELYVLDLDMQPVPPGILGELYISGVGLAKGYINNETLTNEAFVPNPFAAESDPVDFQRMYRTGDLVRYQQDGLLEYVGRTDSQIKIRGLRIELGDIDASLTQVETVAESVTVLVGQGANAKLVSYVVPAGEIAADFDDFKQLTLEKLRSLLPGYMLPDVLTVLDKMPVNANGKLDRKALPEPVLVGQKDSREELVDENEKLVAEQFSDILGISFKDLDRRSHFFELGGNSLLASRLAMRLSNVGSRDFRVRDIFDKPRISQLAALFNVNSSGAKHKTNDVPFTQVARKSHYPLSSNQQRLWFHHLLQGASPTYNIPLLLEVDGNIDVVRLQNSVHQLLEHHDVLRMRYIDIDGHPQQVEDTELQVKIHITDLSAAHDKQKRELRTAAVSEFVDTAFDLETELPIRVGLIRSAVTHDVGSEARASLLMLCIHHIAADGISMERLLDDLVQGYRQDKESPTNIAKDVLQYQDFVAWQGQWLASEQAEQESQYWRESLTDLPPLLSLPTDFPRPANQTYVGACLPIAIDTKLTQTLRHVAAEQNVSLFVVMMTAYAALLSRYTGADDFAIGAPFGGRTTLETESMVGYFANTLPIRCRPSSDQSLQDLLGSINETCMQAQENQRLPLEVLVNQLCPERSNSYSPLFQVLCSLEQTIDYERKFAPLGWGVKPYKYQHHISKFDLSLMLQDDPNNNRIDGYLEFRTDLFHPETIKRMGEQFLAVLGAIATEPQQTLAQLNLVGDSGKLLVNWESEALPASITEHGLYHRFAQQVVATPNAQAVIDERGHLTYRELDEQARALAVRLQAKGVVVGSAVGVMMTPSNQRIVTLLAILCCGAYYVPMDAQNPPKRLLDIVQQVGMQHLVCDEFDVLPEGLSDAVTHCMPSINNDQALTTELVVPDVRGGDLAYVLFTSGSTGQAKGVLISQRAVLRLVTNANFMVMDQSTRFLHAAPLAFDASTLEIWAPLVNGGCVVSHQDRVLEAKGLRRFIHEYGINSAWLTSSLFNHLIDAEPECVSGLSYLLVGGDVVSPQHVRKAYKVNPTLQIINGYGPTESTTFAACYNITQAWLDSAATSVPIGHALQYTHLLVLDEGRKPVPEGVVGELYIGGAGLADGYLNQSELTRQAFVSLPSAEKQRFFRTGDLVRQDNNGCLYFVGRKDHQVKVRGFRIELAEIDAAIGLFPGVNTSVTRVVGEHHEKQLVSWVVFQNEPEIEALMTHLRERLPGYSVPAFIQSLSAMPLTPNGKLDVKALPQVDLTALSEADYEAPQTENEKILVSLWAELFELEPERISRHAHFFRLGGHSLLATRLTSLLAAKYKRTLSLTVVFDQPLLSELALNIKELVSDVESHVLDEQGSAADQMSFSQSRLWFLEQLQGPSSVYHISAVFDCNGPLDVAALVAAIKGIVERHEVLRTLYIDDGESVTCQCQPADEFVIETITVQEVKVDTSTIEQEEVLVSQIRSFCEASFNLSSDLPIRVGLMRLGEHRHVLILCFHHIAFDGWSLDLFFKELVQSYEVLASPAGTSVQLPQPPAMQYSQFSVWQRQQLSVNRQEQLTRYWQTQLRDLPPLLELPRDYGRPSVMTYKGDCLNVTVPDDLVRQLTKLSTECNASLFMSMLSGFNLLMAKLSGENDIAVGTPVANRTHEAVMDTIGFFANTLVLRSVMDLDSNLAQYLQTLKSTVLQAQEHQDMPFELLVEQLKPERSLSYSPLFQVMFSLRHEASAIAALGESEVQPIRLPHKVSKFDLSFMLEEADGRISGFIEFSTDLFTLETIRDFWKRYLFLLQQMVDQPKIPLRNYALAPQENFGSDIAAVTGEVLDYQATGIHHAVHLQALKTPDAIAIRCQNRQLDYQTLSRSVDALAANLRAQGISTEQPVAVYMHRNCDMLISLLAVMQAGGFYVPLDPAYPEARISQILDSAKPVAILTEERLAKQLDSSLPLLLLDQITLENWDDMANPSSLACSGERTAYAIYTSGSTGKPKGIAISHRNAQAMLAWAQAEYSTEQLKNVLAATSVCFDLSIFELFLPLQVGGTVTIVDDLLSLLDDDFHSKIDFAGESGITLLNTVPSAMEAVLDADCFPSSVTTVNLAGEPLSRALVDRLYAQSSVQKVYNLYGPSEDTTYSTYSLVRRRAAITQDAELVTLKPLIGRPIANTRAYVLDEGLNLVPIGVPGELYLAGDGVAKGYLGQPDLTESVFLPCPFLPSPLDKGDRMYKTGDKVRLLANGELDYLGRLDNQVKLRGFRIELGEIESVAQEHISVKEAIAVVTEHPVNRQLILYITGSSSESSEIDSMIKEVQFLLTQKLPDYMVPKRVIWLQELPLLPNGKVDRKALSSKEMSDDSLLIEALQTASEKKLAEVWMPLLDRQNLGRFDNFFERGGHSLLATQLVNQIKSEFKVTMTVRDIFQRPQLAEQAALIDMLSLASERDDNKQESEQESQMEVGTL